MAREVLLDLGFLTEEERDIINNVISKDVQIRKQEQSRISELREELDRLKEDGLPEEEIEAKNDRYCARCQTYFGIVFNRGALCPRCELKVCKVCRKDVDGEGWMCTLCSKVREVKAQSGAWFFQSHKEKSGNLFGSILVRKSLRRLPTSPEDRRLDNQEQSPFNDDDNYDDDDQEFDQDSDDYRRHSQGHGEDPSKSESTLNHPRSVLHNESHVTYSDSDEASRDDFHHTGHGLSSDKRHSKEGESDGSESLESDHHYPAKRTGRVHQTEVEGRKGDHVGFDVKPRIHGGHGGSLKDTHAVRGRFSSLDLEDTDISYTPAPKFSISSRRRTLSDDGERRGDNRTTNRADKIQKHDFITQPHEFEAPETQPYEAKTSHNETESKQIAARVEVTTDHTQHRDEEPHPDNEIEIDHGTLQDNPRELFADNRGSEEISKEKEEVVENSVDDMAVFDERREDEESGGESELTSERRKDEGSGGESEVTSERRKDEESGGESEVTIERREGVGSGGESELTSHRRKDEVSGNGVALSGRKEHPSDEPVDEMPPGKESPPEELAEVPSILSRVKNWEQISHDSKFTPYREPVERPKVNAKVVQERKPITDSSHGMMTTSKALIEELKTVLGEDNESHDRDDVVASRDQDDVVPLGDQDDVVPLGDQDDVVPSRSQGDVAPLRDQDDVVPSREETDVVLSRDRDDVVPPRDQDDVVPSYDKDDVVPSGDQDDKDIDIQVSRNQGDVEALVNDNNVEVPHDEDVIEVPREQDDVVLSSNQDDVDQDGVGASHGQHGKSLSPGRVDVDVSHDQNDQLVPRDEDDVNASHDQDDVVVSGDPDDVVVPHDQNDSLKDIDSSYAKSQLLPQVVSEIGLQSSVDDDSSVNQGGEIKLEYNINSDDDVIPGDHSDDKRGDHVQETGDEHRDVIGDTDREPKHPEVPVLASDQLSDNRDYVHDHSEPRTTSTGDDRRLSEPRDDESKFPETSGYVAPSDETSSKQTPSISGSDGQRILQDDDMHDDQQSTPVIVTPDNNNATPPRSNHSSIIEYEEDLDVSFSKYGIGVENRKLKDQLSMGSRESIASYYSNAGGEVYGKYPVSGEIYFGMKYDAKLQQFHVQVHQARDITAVDEKNGVSDPYVKTYLLPDRSRGGKRKTKVKKNTVNPVFDEILTYKISYDEILHRTLWLAVWNHDRFGHNDFLGEVLVPIDEYIQSGFTLEDPEPQWYHLCERQAENPDFSYNGEIVFALKYVPPSAVVSKKKKKKKQEEKGELHINIIEATNLLAKDANGFSDPFCKSYLLPDKSKKTKQKTSVVKKSLNPKWNYHFVYDNVTHEELMDRVLELTVWDFDRGSSNEFLGGVRLGLGAGLQEWDDANAEEQAAWNKMLNNQNNWNQVTVTLRDHMGDAK